MTLLTRWKYRVLAVWNGGDELNRRVKVELTGAAPEKGATRGNES